MALPRKIGTASLDGELTFHPGKAGWRQLEKAYGHKLSGWIRIRVARICRIYQEEAGFERSAAVTGAVIWILEEQYKAIGAFLTTHMANSLKGIPDDAEREARWLLRETYQDLGLDHYDPDSLQDLLFSHQVAIRKAIEVVDQGHKDGFRDGRAWEAMLGKIIEVLSKVGLPTEARKDDGKRKTEPSPFVLFIHELQTYLSVRSPHPEKHLRLKSHAAIAGDVSRVRRRLRDKLQGSAPPHESRR
jgi:hypothetical protein